MGFPAEEQLTSSGRRWMDGWDVRIYVCLFNVVLILCFFAHHITSVT